MNQKYNRWKSTLKENIFNYDYYTNFNKIYKNIENIRTELNILNTLIGSKNI